VIHRYGTPTTGHRPVDAGKEVILWKDKRIVVIEDYPVIAEFVKRGRDGKPSGLL
jgi:hypothetical protein